MLDTDIVILNFKQICQLYNLKHDEATFYLNQKDCPVLPRKKNAPYKVVKDEFEKWLKSQKRGGRSVFR